MTGNTAEVLAFLPRWMKEFDPAVAEYVRALVSDAGNTPREQLEKGRCMRLQSAAAIAALAGDFRGAVLRAGYHFSTLLRQKKLFGKEEDCLRFLVSKLLKAGEAPSAEDLSGLIVDAASLVRTKDSYDMGYLRIDAILNAVERRAEVEGLAKKLRKALEGLRAQLVKRAESGRRDVRSLGLPVDGDLASFLPAADRRHFDRIEAVLDGRQNHLFADGSDWERCIEDALAQQTPRTREIWTAMLRHGTTNAKPRVPNSKWLADASGHIGLIGAAEYAERLEPWLADVELPVGDSAQAIIRGLILTAIVVPLPEIPGILGRFGERCYKKIPGFGPGSVKLGNACMTALAMMPENRGAAELARLKQRIRYASGKDILGKSLTTAADRAGLSVAELEERSVPDFGLGAGGHCSEPVGDHVGIIAIRDGTVVLEWRDPKGAPLKALPAALREAERETLQAAKRKAKEVTDSFTAQRLRVESLYLAQRQWPFAEWRRYYLDHPLVGHLARDLIWTFEADGRSTTGMFARDALRDSGGKELRVADGAIVRLWHPIEAAAAAVAAWRSAVEALDIVQPFKQAHREIYAITDAERRTGIYSNRFAAHVLRQHQFTALCRQRGWRYELQGAWDSHNVPSRPIEALGLAAEFAVEAPMPEGEAEGGYSGFGVVFSDQLRFVAGRDSRPLADIPPVIFSEIMRDVDMFVSVCSVGSDPTWSDGGPNGRYRGYWSDYAFGALSESASARRSFLETLLPRLRIAAQCRLGDRELIVEGKRRTYKIHLGSGNVRMAPNDAYLCIVVDRPAAAKAGGVRLPFAGDQTLSLILSKAFLLAEDNKIKDPTILSQIGEPTPSEI